MGVKTSILYRLLGGRETLAFISRLQGPVIHDVMAVVFDVADMDGVVRRRCQALSEVPGTSSFYSDARQPPSTVIVRPVI